MNIKNNIIDYLFDNDYVICTYDNYVYIYKYEYLERFNDKNINLKVKSKLISIKGNDLIIVKITKCELLIKGTIKSVEMINNG